MSRATKNALLGYAVGLVAGVAFRASVGHADPPAAPMLTRTVAQNPPPATGPDTWLTLYAGIASMNGVAITLAEIRTGLAPPPDPNGDDSAFEALGRRVKAPFVDRGYLAGVDFADIDNDGQREYVLWSISRGFLRAADIAGVYRPRADALVEVSIPPLPSSHMDNPAMFDDIGRVFVSGASPFLSVDREGVTMRFVEGNNGARQRARYLWKGGAIRLLDRAPCTAHACDTPTSYAN